MKLLQISLASEEHNKLKEYCKKENIPMKVVVRQLVKEFLKKN